MSLHLATALLASGTTVWSSGDTLGLFIFLTVVFGAMSRGPRREIRWEYTDKDGRQRFTDWYDADTHSIIEDAPDRFTVMRRG